MCSVTEICCLHRMRLDMHLHNNIMSDNDNTNLRVLHRTLNVTDWQQTQSEMQVLALVVWLPFDAV